MIRNAIEFEQAALSYFMFFEILGCLSVQIFTDIIRIIEHRVMYIQVNLLVGWCVVCLTPLMRCCTAWQDFSGRLVFSSA